jgi:hypothetical protein
VQAQHEAGQEPDVVVVLDQRDEVLRRRHRAELAVGPWLERPKNDLAGLGESRTE